MMAPSLLRTTHRATFASMMGTPRFIKPAVPEVTIDETAAKRLSCSGACGECGASCAQAGGANVEGRVRSHANLAGTKGRTLGQHNAPTASAGLPPDSPGQRPPP